MTLASSNQNDSFWDSEDQQQNQLFHRVLVALFIISLMIAVSVQLTELPELSRAEKEKLPPQLMKLIERKQIEVQQLEPEPVIVEVEEVIIEEPIEVAEVEPEVKPEKIEVDEQVKQKAREKAKKSGLLAFADELNAMHQQASSQAFDAFASDASVADELGADAQSGTSDSDALAKMALASSADFNGASDGTENSSLDLAALNDDVMRSKPRSDEERLLSRSKNKLALSSDNNASQPSELEQALLSSRQQGTATGDEELAEGQEEQRISSGRSTESIRQVFDKNKAALYAIYRRALRKDPALAGRVTIDLIISPDGSVSSVELVLSELELPELENKLLARIRMIQFGAFGLEDTQLNYTFNFLPF